MRALLSAFLSALHISLRNAGMCICGSSWRCNVIAVATGGGPDETVEVAKGLHNSSHPTNAHLQGFFVVLFA